MRRAIILGALALAGCAGGANRSEVPAVSGLEAAAARLPASVAGFTRGDTAWLERDQPGMGVAVDYAGPGRSAVATVSLYDRAGGAVPDDAASPRLRTEFDTAVADVLATADGRTAQRMSESGRSEVPVPGGTPLSCSRLDGLYGRQEVRTLVCLGVAAGRFVKIQVTSPGRQIRPVDPIPFVVGVTQAARGQG